MAGREFPLGFSFVSTGMRKGSDGRLWPLCGFVLMAFIAIRMKEKRREMGLERHAGDVI